MSKVVSPKLKHKAPTDPFRLEHIRQSIPSRSMLIHMRSPDQEAVQVRQEHQEVLSSHGLAIFSCPPVLQEPLLETIPTSS